MEYLNRYRLAVFGVLVILVAALLMAVTQNKASAGRDTTWGTRAHMAARGECSWLGCGYIRHYSPDDGFDAAFVVRCYWESDRDIRYVYEGQTSSCQDADQVYVAAGNQIVCLTTYGWQTRYDATGWHKIYDGQNPLCVHQRD